MLWITLLSALLLSLVALAYVVLPLLTRQAPLLQVEDDRLTDLLARKDGALRAIKDLEFDHQVGKISGEDYDRFHQRLNRQAIVLIQQLEKIAPESQALDTQIEGEIAQHRKALASPAMQPNTNGANTNGSTTNGATSATRFCTECGAQLEAKQKFCANCGASVAKVVAVQI